MFRELICMPLAIDLSLRLSEVIRVPLTSLFKAFDPTSLFIVSTSFILGILSVFNINSCEFCIDNEQLLKFFISTRFG